MEYRVVLAPQIEISADDFSQEWNQTPECREVAEARIDETNTRQYDPTLGVITVLASVGVSVASAALYDLIKSTLFKRGVRKQIEITQVDTREGDHMLVVKITEE
ncbi:MAG: hypothetical protein QF898_07050 [SAR202 cluster bacterium]|jgi:hypothetical protein|nr:hypothetical protein [SAR202 cluster bacterium]MDP6713490.1 hypothetical protein [SAR202 cluster bacterium]|tara:strand:- start:273 stop:587 length:315 start_codon:yes stop_codon:yes gene_type:complete